MLSTKVHSVPDVYQVRVPFQNISTNATNCYIVRDGGEALVVDTGGPSDEGFAVLSAALEELGVETERTSFFLTHLHLDHAGLINRVAHPGASLYVSALDYETLKSASAGSTYDQARGAMVAEGVSLSDASGYARCAVELLLFDASRLFLVPSREGALIDVGRFSFQVVETPGHTPGHLSLWEPTSSILFGGDHVLFVISPSIALFPDGADGLQIYLDSLEKVRRLSCKKLFLAHGELRDDFEARIDWLEEHLRKRLDETVSIVRARPGQSGEAVIRSIKWNVPFACWEDISFMQRWCIVTEGMVILNHLVERGRIRRRCDEAGLRRYY